MLRRMRLAVFDGPEYHRRRVLRSRGALLIHSDDRVEDFSCSSRAAREIATALSQAGEPLVAVGQSLGALAALHVHWTNPGLFAGLLLQSGSFFHRDTENYEREFPRFGRVHRFVDRVLNERGRPEHVPVTMTCGLEESNRWNNRAVAEALAAHGWEIRLVEHPGGHDWDAWKPVLRQELPGLRRRAAG